MRLTGDFKRLARCVVDRRQELGLSRAAVRELGGPSIATQQLIEAEGRASIQVLVAGRYERAFGWASGSVRTVLAGGAPTVERP